MSRLIILAIGRILNAISAVAMVRLYTELLAPEQVGKLSLFLALTSLFTLTLIAPVSSYVMRKTIDWHAEGLLREHLKRPLIYFLAVALFAAVGSETLVRIGALHAPILAGPIVGLAVLGLAVSNVGSQLFNYLGRPFTFVTLSCAINWGAVALAAILSSRIFATAEVWVLGLATAQLMGGCLAICLMGRLQEDCAPFSGKCGSGFQFRTVASYSVPLLLATCLSWVQTDGYRYLFVHIADERTLGLFVAGFAVGVSPMAFVDRLIADAYLPTLTRDLALKNKEFWPRSWDTYASAAILPLVLFGMLTCSGTNLFAKLLVSSTYSAFSWVGFWGGLIKSLQMIVSLYVGFSYAALDTKHLAAPYLIGALVTLLCMPFLMLAFAPILGLAASLSCGALAILIGMSRSVQKRYSVRFPYAAFCRAVALGAPIVVANTIAKTVVHNLNITAAIAIIGGDVAYIAAVCWLLYPKATSSNRFQPPVVVTTPTQEAQI